MDAEKHRRALEFVESHKKDGCFLLPNAWDVGSARLLESAGFPAIATTSAGIAFSLGRPDHGYGGGRLGRAAVLGRVGEMAAGVGVPVSADLEDGYGRAPQVVAETVELALGAGAAGGNIEDFTGDRRAPLYDAALAVDRIRAARGAIDASGRPFALVGRTDVLLTGGTLDEAVRRANAYLGAGADCAFVPGAADGATIGALVKRIDGPLNVVMGLTGGELTMAELRELGVRRVTVGGSIVRAMYRQLADAARELMEQGTFTYAANQLPQDEINALYRGGAERQ
ncbi:isocitrate lyase/phosphoenolpyruvate mutase family protein [Streptomyces roseirectus]|uniref:Isocitrate lyase/phosphoenolpyruvate mutase family protein n=1 Tax=Streptomyces roseirectus TaxID=2768066 RepID=A0A7H0IGH4_9ACTN|nr:isocitrate lyase/phosphoenolpyruvate mutase family protein [Streptomyces roseirectus]QNP71890.1 isocitrate lyase/phosphoenolpyruvate mutase family protein [Streptomyces roseirectus]